MKNKNIKQTLLFLVSIVLVNCSNDEPEQESSSSKYDITINGQNYKNEDVATSAATFTEGIDVNSGNNFYSVVTNLEDASIRITGGPLVIEGVIMAIDENSNDSSGLVISTNAETYVGISGSITIERDNRYQETNLGNGAKTGKNEISVNFSGIFRDTNSNEVSISGSYFVAKKSE